MSIGIGTIVIAGTLTGAVALQRSIAGAEKNSTNQATQLRALDYITLDARRATRISVPADLSSVTFTLPDYYQGCCNSSAAPSDPKWDSTTKTVYYDGSNSAGGVPANAVTYSVIYQVDPQTNNLVRSIKNNISNATNTMIVAANVASFRIMQPSAQAGTARFTCSVTFFPVFGSTIGQMQHNWTWGAAAPNNADGAAEGDYYVDQSPVYDPDDVAQNVSNPRVTYYKNDVYIKRAGSYIADSNTVYCNVFLRNPGARGL